MTLKPSPINETKASQVGCPSQWRTFKILTSGSIIQFIFVIYF